MTIERKLLGTSPSGGATDVADVFSTYLYTGNGTTNTAITNGIDLAGEGGMVWIKSRTTTENHAIFDTERQGANWYLSSDTTAAETQDTGNPMMVSLNSNGFTLGNNNVTNGGNPFVSWTFRKKKKFFDVVTWTGNGVAGREIAHGLGGAVGMIVVKRTSGTTGWSTWHRSANSGNAYLELNEVDAQNTNGKVYWGNNTSYIAPTSTEFTVATDSALNENGQTYVAYLFADNSSEDADDQMIKCGSYTGAYPTQVEVNLGWEPQWIIVRPATQSSNWDIIDNMRGNPSDLDGAFIGADVITAEGNNKRIQFTSTGFETMGGGTSANANGANHIYMAIRGPMMVEPEAATDVFAVDAAGSGVAPAYISGFPVDFALYKSVVGSAGAAIGSRMLGKNEMFATTTAAVAASTALQFDYSNGFYDNTSRSANYVAWMWKKAKGFMDVVPYDGNATSGRTVAHSLSVIPELMICKRRSSTEDWTVYSSTSGASYYLNLNNNQAVGGSSNIWNDTAPTSTVFSVGTSSRVNSSGQTYVAFLFATLAGISKVGSYTGTGSNINVDCGFSAGARFILIKRTDATGDWYLYDTLRGIVAGADPFLKLNTTEAQDEGNDGIDPLSSGFIVTSGSGNNTSGGTYIFYAIA